MSCSGDGRGPRVTSRGWRVGEAPPGPSDRLAGREPQRVGPRLSGMVRAVSKHVGKRRGAAGGPVREGAGPGDQPLSRPAASNVRLI